MRVILAFWLLFMLAVGTAGAQNVLGPPLLGPPLPAAPLIDLLRPRTDAAPSGVIPPPGSAGFEMIESAPGMNPLAALDGAGSSLPGAGERGGLSAAMTILVVLTVVSLAPSIILMTTCFLRIVIVLGLLKQAMGTQTIPPPQVIVSLALFMTLMVMSPTIDRVWTEAIVPYQSGLVTDYDTLWQLARQPIRDFMFAQIDACGNWPTLYTVMEYRDPGVDPASLTCADVDMISLIPAFMLSELKVAFLLGFKVYLPFLVIDMVVSSVLISMSMMMLPPVLISLPFKILLFIMVDGWAMVVGSLMEGFAAPEPISMAAFAWAGFG